MKRAAWEAEGRYLRGIVQRPEHDGPWHTYVPARRVHALTLRAIRWRIAGKLRGWHHLTERPR